MGYTVAEIDTVLAYYCQKSYDIYFEEYRKLAVELDSAIGLDSLHQKAKSYAMKKVYRELEQGIQGLEIKLNTVASSRGDYIFTTFSFGVDQNEFAQMVSEVILKVRMGGQGKAGFKKQMLFPYRLGA